MKLLTRKYNTSYSHNLINLINRDFAGFPAYPLSVALGVAGLGIVLGLPFRRQQHHHRSLA